MTNWKQSTFSLPNQQESGTVAVLTNPDYLKVVETVKDATGTALLPNWYPDGTTVEQVEDNSNDNFLSYSIILSKAKQHLSLSALTYDKNSTINSMYEKNEDSGDVQYTSSGMPYYVMENLERTVVVWKDETAEYSLSGFLTQDELERMMNSIDLGDD